MCRMFAISSATKRELTQKTKDLLAYYSNGNADGFGVAYIKGNEIKSFKDPSPAYKYIFQNRPFPTIDSKAVIAHDRLATSQVCYLNTHPFLNEDKSIALIHNGMISKEPHDRMKKKLQAEGYKFSSKDVDSEVLLHMYQKYGDDFIKEVKKEASYSTTNVILLKKDGTILAVSDGSLYTTKFDNGSIMVSTTGLFKDSKAIPEGEMLTIKDGKVLDKKKIFEPYTYASYNGGTYGGYGRGHHAIGYDYVWSDEAYAYVPRTQSTLFGTPKVDEQVDGKLYKRAYVALEDFKLTKPFNAKGEERKKAISKLFETLTDMYARKDMYIKFEETDNNKTEYDEATKTLVVSGKHLDLMDFLQKFAKSAFRTFTDDQAKQWAEEMYKKTYPGMYKRMKKKELKKELKEAPEGRINFSINGMDMEDPYTDPYTYRPVEEEFEENGITWVWSEEAGTFIKKTQQEQLKELEREYKKTHSNPMYS